MLIDRMLIKKECIWHVKKCCSVRCTTSVSCLVLTFREIQIRFQRAIDHWKYYVWEGFTPKIRVWNVGLHIFVQHFSFWGISLYKCMENIGKWPFFAVFEQLKVLKCCKNQNNIPCGLILSLNDTLEQFLVFEKKIVGPSGG